jgi:predicted dinucleotide-binding enzyme
MRYGILGTGVVGRTLAAKLAELGHEVMLGTRSPAETLARAEGDAMGNAPFGDWQAAHPGIRLGTFEEAARHGQSVINATNGMASMPALRLAGEDNLAGKVLIDVGNPLDFSGGMPPTLGVSNTDSLGEAIQRSFPEARVVKTLNTVTAALMVNPGLLGDEHTVFLSGNDAEAKAEVAELLRSFGWRDILDLGDIRTARGAEMYLPLWLALFMTSGSPILNVKVLRPEPA